MFDKLRKKLGGEQEEEGSFAITDESLIRRFTDNPDFPFLVSFPRTGSHWLRLLMELYFAKPSLVRAFYTQHPTDFTCLHTHDDDLQVRRRNALYLYRRPEPTIYSQLNYYDEDCNDRARIAHWAQLYGRHLKKWLLRDDFTTKKTVLTYEGLKRNLAAEFERVCQHFDAPFEPARLDAASARVTKETVKNKTRHDQHVVNSTETYQDQRQSFLERHGAFVLETTLAEDPKLEPLFPAE